MSVRVPFEVEIASLIILMICDVGTLTTHKGDRELAKHQHSSYRHSVVSYLKILPW